MQHGEPISPSVVEAVGETPLVDLQRIVHESEGRVLAKLEGCNPGGSKKDRIAVQMLRDARREGSLAPHQTVVEVTSGNTGMGLAMACAVLGHPFVAVMSRGNSTERALMMRAYGAEVLLVDQAGGSRPGRVSGADLELCEREAERVVAESGAWRADQFSSLANFRAHRLGTAQEILRQTGGRLDAFCDFVGTGGTFAGCAATFKEYRADIRCYVVEPQGAAVLAGEALREPAHRIQGGGYGRRVLELLDPERIDGYVQVGDEEAAEAARELARKEGILAGWSAGANVAAARKLLAGPLHAGTIVIVLPDSGMKYLSTELWRGEAAAADAPASLSPSARREE